MEAAFLATALWGPCGRHSAGHAPHAPDPPKKCAQHGGAVFQTQPLNGEQWALCIGIGALSLLVHEAARCIPSEDQ